MKAPLSKLRNLCFPLLCLPLTIYANQIEGLRDSRYCEILYSKSRLNLAVYNTIGLNDCPEANWGKITKECVKKETDSSFVKLNGPRYWMIDGMVNSQLVNPEKKVICGLAMREAGVLKLGITDLLTASEPYKQHQVDRQTTWIYKSGKPVYELIDPKGQVFVMQSYSTEKKPQTAETLEKLGTELKLPKGWQFRTGTLKQDTELKAIDNKATVIQDDFLNTYQLATHDFIN
ncbi:hypothetical protein [Legionella hackeliae]|uniref:Uncharacterized protein n=1 Tax=Legionella hackeliae TaxID=449 RepID=A0A0A8UTD5_LEGHA|nr:hypothetical protein [Legionella hackeliae]KTD06660.1 hypothetical protein Lhac_3183 [Legionella hackeliae]CEK10781.1 conserved exported protein of unknown function [Legionella hackeliae]STX47519.1 Uncharacterised protein [Legionella hackeliae]